MRFKLELFVPQVFEIKLPNGQMGAVVYPDDKILRTAVFQPEKRRVVVHYLSPFMKFDIAEATADDPYLFIVTTSLPPSESDHESE
jgi:hypothetical protein